MKELTKKEKELLIILVKAEKSTARFLSGFAQSTEIEKKKEAFCDNLIEKLKSK